MIDALQFWLARAFMAFFATIPHGWALAIGRGLGALCFHVLRLRRKVVMANLRHVLGGTRSEAELVEIARQAYRSFGMTFAEILRWSSPGSNAYEADVEIEHLERFRELWREKRPVIFAVPHYGNFDLGAYAFHAPGFRVHVVMKPVKSERFNRLIVETREKHHLHMVLTGGGGVFEGLEAHLRAGGWAAMLPDQNAKARGVTVDWLGKPASIFKGPAQLALATGAQLVMGALRRRPEDPRRHFLHMTFLEKRAPSGDPEADVKAYTQAIADAVKDVVLRDPGQYFWFHRLWGKHVAAGIAPPASSAPAR
ncbi:MAG TPA: lysophospholipid acyltransferase family protein [Planctomycetota bacterium]|nr:lysophospholipid acyltransferase family protein [Planctomycetota bacterium]